MSQALVLEGATVIPARHGTAPGQVAPTTRGALVLLPGPPHEMTPMLDELVASLGTTPRATRVLACIGTTESDAQLRAQRALGSASYEMTVLGAPGGGCGCN